ncbi:uncharacterized protein LOC111372456 [Olea europaea var. sylvestris]|uniref:uncharacterized protein LOC111372456 n=1 Tax=Olea europaea var. sylvestris TaxID=158386 RepID=UPI000C1D177C|nr:uncharacterized protein LOC111372456 [Olea europaea var. sylvestris]
MVDGIISSRTKSTYELPSQEELIRCAFAGDDVEEEFEKDKEAILNEESPELEKPVLLSGWGQWTDIQKKKAYLTGCSNSTIWPKRKGKKPSRRGRMHILIMLSSLRCWIKMLLSVSSFFFISERIHALLVQQ